MIKASMPPLGFRRRPCSIKKKREAIDGEPRHQAALHGGTMNAFAGLASGLERVNDRLLLACRWLIITIVAVLAAILIAAVFYRYALNNAIAWSEEGSKYLMVWLTFLGAPIALRQAAHINIDLLVKLFPPRGRQAFYLGINLVIIITMGILLWKGWEFAELGARQVASSFNFSMVWMYIAVPIGSALTCLVATELSLKALCGIADPVNGIDESMSAIVDEGGEAPQPIRGAD
jgi:TRAP-type C4-dicarboxylate transport system permease small subunit